MFWFQKTSTDKIIEDFRTYLEIIDVSLPSLISTVLKFTIVTVLGVLSSMSIMPLLINIMAGV